MSIDELKALWSAQADEHNQWDDLGEDEKIEFAVSVEREACAKVSESFKEEGMEWRWDCVPGEEIAAAIRSRGQK